ncbi:hypothetical protein GCM10009868_40430 [Terrabacter aerolatus]|uniref:Uncharacterized protein n=1 Tax=Terrabacter aerolatus TaxID=422442 RepID=A0A512D670_9MICO|nr:hypothetical protein TAE01_37860 [Terrabacter aerolatus]
MTRARAVRAPGPSSRLHARPTSARDLRSPSPLAISAEKQWATADGPCHHRAGAPPGGALTETIRNEEPVMATGLTMEAKRSLCLADVAYPFPGECRIRHDQTRRPPLPSR